MSLGRAILLRTLILSFMFFLGSCSDEHQFITPLEIPCEKDIQKMFIVTGYLSSDRLGAWYLRNKRITTPDLYCQAVGGHFLKQEKAHIVAQLEEIMITNGLINLFINIPSSISKINQLATHITTHGFKEVVLVDVSWITIPLARKLKKIDPTIHITFIAPPELWFWGRWGIDKLLKAYANRIICLYPHEVAWYKNIGLDVTWMGYPFYNEFTPYLAQPLRDKKPQIALLPGSRSSEIKKMMPLLMSVAKKLHETYPELTFVIPLAESIDPEIIALSIKAYNLEQVMTLVSDSTEKKKILSHCCCAITKPGTITLDLALLKCPSIITYKVDILTYIIMRFLINPDYISLPNLLTHHEICIELLQYECTREKLYEHTSTLYNEYKNNTPAWQQKLEMLEAFRNTFQSSWKMVE